jgi:hypothetical protein
MLLPYNKMLMFVWKMALLNNLYLSYPCTVAGFEACWAYNIYIFDKA